MATHVETPGHGHLLPLIKALVGAGDRIMALTLPFAVAGVVANLIWPSAFHVGWGAAGTALGVVMLVIGVPIWLGSAAQIVAHVPKGELITTGPYALMLHPLYTSVALLVIPGLGLVLSSWIGFSIGLVLYIFSRRYAPSEERELAERFGEAYARYREKVRWPWL